MKINTLLAIAIFSFSVSSLIASEFFFAPENVNWDGKNYEFELRILGQSDSPEEVTLWYRPFGETNYIPRELIGESGSYYGKVKGTEITNNQIEYYYEVQYASILQTVPNSSAKEQPLKYSSTSYSGDVSILSPEPNREIEPEDLVIAVSFFDVKDEIDLSQVKVILDNIDMTARAYISKELLSLTVSQSLPQGKHTVKVTYSLKQNPVTWDFFIKKDFSDKGSTTYGSASSGIDFQHRGNGYIEFLNEKVGGDARNLSKGNVNFNGNVEWLKFNSNLYITSEGTDREQPRNRYSLGLNAKWLTLELGDFYPRQHELMLWGARVRGVNTEIKTKALDLQVAIGIFNKKIKQITEVVSNDLTVASDSLNFFFVEGESQSINDSSLTFLNDGNQVIIPVGSIRIVEDGTYKRNVRSARLAFGWGASKLGISVLKVKDDIDSFNFLTGRPKDNLVFGGDFGLRFWGGRIAFKSNAAFSLLTDDIRSGALSKKDLKDAGIDIPFDPKDFEDYLVINTSLTPINPRGGNSIAWDAGANFNAIGHTASVEFKSHGAQYQSLGINYLRNDYQAFIVSDRFRVSNKVYLNARFENYKDNLDDSKESTTSGNKLDVGFNVFLGGNSPQIGFNYGLYTRANDADSSSIQNEEDNKTNSISTNITQPLNINFLGESNVSVGWSYSNRNDNVNAGTGDSENNLVNLGVSSKLEDIPLKINAQYSFNQSKSINSLTASKAKNTFNSFYVDGNYEVIPEKSEVYGSFGYTRANSEDEDFNLTNFSAGSRYFFTKNHSLTGEMFLYVLPKNNDITFRMRYQAYF